MIDHTKQIVFSGRVIDLAQFSEGEARVPAGQPHAGEWMNGAGPEATHPPESKPMANAKKSWIEDRIPHADQEDMKNLVRAMRSVHSKKYGGELTREEMPKGLSLSRAKNLVKKYGEIMKESLGIGRLMYDGGHSTGSSGHGRHDEAFKPSRLGPSVYVPASIMWGPKVKGADK